ncbi:MAG: hypothetical protein DMG49_02210 [Acidobacteria bacterium]|nr:MAG: hypothetical protein DMG49_02210 [Acidobacteriota bacterium]
MSQGVPASASQQDLAKSLDSFSAQILPSTKTRSQKSSPRWVSNDRWDFSRVRDTKEKGAHIASWPFTTTR